MWFAVEIWSALFAPRRQTYHSQTRNKQIIPNHATHERRWGISITKILKQRKDVQRDTQRIKRCCKVFVLESAQSFNKKNTMYKSSVDSRPLGHANFTTGAFFPSCDTDRQCAKSQSSWNLHMES